MFIGDWLMSSDCSTALAVCTPDGWAVSWIPQRLFDRNSAITALVLAEAIAKGAAPSNRWWPHIQNWLAELELSEAALTALPEPVSGGVW